VIRASRIRETGLGAWVGFRLGWRVWLNKHQWIASERLPFLPFLAWSSPSASTWTRIYREKLSGLKYLVAGALVTVAPADGLARSMIGLFVIVK
jgi:hypothetical protein